MHTPLLSRAAVLALILLPLAARPAPLPYRIVHTGVLVAYDATHEIPAPKPGEPFYGQDANHRTNLPKYTDNGDGTVTDTVTGLVWRRDMGAKMTLEEAEAKLRELNAGKERDWRIPTIKELYSLALYSGRVFGAEAVTPFLDSQVFIQPLGDTSKGGRAIDAQTWSATEYRGKTMRGDVSRFGINFVDGRIKAYPVRNPRTGEPTRMYFRFVRGNPAYGRNDFKDNGDGTVTDRATGLMWQKADSGRGMDWPTALRYASEQKTGGHSDWRLPSIKELQSIVDYTRCPQHDGTAAVDPVFEISRIEEPDKTKNFPYFWSATTLLDGPTPGNAAAYVAFGNASAKPFGTIVDAHGAGAVRSDPKSQTGAGGIRFFGPQGDLLRVLNHVRCVRTVE